jgi:peptidyl-prolyl cis-trans isomerase D
MATLQKIRNQAGLLVAVVVGLALFAFILGDMLNSGSSMFSNSQNEIAEIAGKSIPVQDYSLRIEKTLDNAKRTSGENNLDEETVEYIREQTWDQLVREYVMMDEYEEVSIGVTPEELFDMVQGNNIHPQILEVPIFKNQSGQFDRNLIIQFLKNMDNDPSGNARISWLQFEKGIQEERLNTKYNNLIEKGLYITSLQAEKEALDRGNTVDIEFMQIAYSSLNDSVITVSDEDVKKYYNEKKENYERTATRDIEYVTFDVLPSEEDSKLAERWINDIYNEYETSENDNQFISLNSDVPYDQTYYGQGEYASASIDSFAFASELGNVYGPYFEDGSYKIAKVTNIVNLSDSVKASHILIKAEDFNNNIAAAQLFVDSLMNLVQNGTSFEALARIHGTDGTKDKGGDLGWFKSGSMVQPFSDSCFFADKGDLKTATTQFGVHLIKVTDQSTKKEKRQIGILERKVEPSSKTYQFIYQKASEFAGLNNTIDKFEKAASEQGLTKKVANNLTENDKKIAGLESPRELIRWTYRASEGEVSNVYEFGNKFVVATLKDVREKGYIPVDELASEIRNALTNEKKAEVLMKEVDAKIAEGKSMSEIADEMNGTIKTAANVNFAAFSVPGLGIEPNLSGTAPYLAENELSKAIEGKLGVYLIRTTKINEPKELSPESEKTHLLRTQVSKINYLVFEALKKNANIEDNRSKFF